MSAAVRIFGPILQGSAFLAGLTILFGPAVAYFQFDPPAWANYVIGAYYLAIALLAIWGWTFSHEDTTTTPQLRLGISLAFVAIFVLVVTRPW